jgi:RimJ/RimL family protein N-acetyltransferase
LEPLGNRHLDALSPIIDNDPQLMKFSSLRVENSSDLAAYIDHALQMKSRNERYPLAIYDKTLNQWAGSTSFTFISDKDGRLEIGFTWIGKAFQRTGINTSMKFLMLQYAFEYLGFNRVELRADSRNMQSRRAMEKIGAIYEGTLRNHMILPDGFKRSTLYYSIIAEEWPTVKAARFSTLTK